VKGWEDRVEHLTDIVLGSDAQYLGTLMGFQVWRYASGRKVIGVDKSRPDMGRPDMWISLERAVSRLDDPRTRLSNMWNSPESLTEQVMHRKPSEGWGGTIIIDENPQLSKEKWDSLPKGLLSDMRSTDSNIVKGSDIHKSIEKNCLKDSQKPEDSKVNIWPTLLWVLSAVAATLTIWDKVK